jgi:hypothetical protein
MRFLGWSALLAGWLVVSAFVLPQTAASAMVTVLAAFLTLSFAAFAVARPPIRYLNTAVALLLAAAALFGEPGAAAISNALAAAALFALSLVSPQHAPREAAPALAAGK